MNQEHSEKLAMVFNVAECREDWTAFTTRVPGDSEAVALWKYPDGTMLLLKKDATLEWQFPEGGHLFFARWPVNGDDLP